MKKLILVIDNIRSVQNTATLFRTAECFGVSKIYLIGTTPCPIDRFGRNRSDFAKVSLGSEAMVDWEYANTISDVVVNLKQDGYKVVALEQAKSSTPLRAYKALQDIALVVGNEVTGVSGETLALVDDIVEIEQFGKKESLNVAIAGSIALYHLRFISDDL